MPRDLPLRVALIGCGQIADAHLQELRQIETATAVAVCDRHFDLARQAAARFGISRAFDSVEAMLDEVRPDVVHVTTPPATHAVLSIQALNGGCHVYVEKPFAVNVSEVDDILRAAQRSQRSVCLGHDQLYDPAWLECRQLYQSGALGEVVHIDSIQGYDLGGSFGSLLARNPHHWVHRLPGGLFQNVISHALARITDFLPDDSPEVRAAWFGRGIDNSFPTELRAMILGQQTTGSLLFTSRAAPRQKIARVYGTKMTVEVDLDARVVRRYRSPSAPSALAKVQLPWWHFKDASRSLVRSMKQLVRSELRFFAGMQELLRQFYETIRRGGPPPVTHADARRITAIADCIFEDCVRNAPERDLPSRLERECANVQ